MKGGAQNKSDQGKRNANYDFIEATMQSYIKTAAKQAKRMNLSDDQKKQVTKTWNRKKAKPNKTNQPKDEEEQANMHIQNIEQAATEFNEILQQAISCDYGNIIHMAKVQRLGEAPH